jgi:hypothetical protein
VSATPVLRMMEGLAKTGYLMIDFTACIGDPEFVFIDNPN